MYRFTANPGNAAEDWIHAPYADTAPTAPILWQLPEAAKNTSDLEVIGFINESVLEALNMTISVVQDDYLNYTWDTDFKSETLHTQASLVQDRDAGRDFFYISKTKYAEMIATINFSNPVWVDFSSHNRTYWFRYSVTQLQDLPGEGASRVYIDPALEQDVYSGDVASFYNTTYKQGWFNISVEKERRPVGMNTIYGVGYRNLTEGYKSVSQYVYNDPESPEMVLTQVPNYSNQATPTFTFNISDNYKVDISTLIINVSNATMPYYHAYAYDSSEFPGYFNITKNITCTDTHANESFYECYVELDELESGIYDVNISIYDKAGWHVQQIQNLEILVTTIDIDDVEDLDDITNDIWLYFNWTPSTTVNLKEYEFALGTELYPDPDFNSIKDWQSACDVLARDRAEYGHRHCLLSDCKSKEQCRSIR
jgi:hypothetical protein